MGDYAKVGMDSYVNAMDEIVKIMSSAKKTITKVFKHAK
jgi:hypothetical protein